MTILQRSGVFMSAPICLGGGCRLFCDGVGIPASFAAMRAMRGGFFGVFAALASPVLIMLAELFGFFLTILAHYQFH